MNGKCRSNISRRKMLELMLLLKPDVRTGLAFSLILLSNPLKS